MRKPLRQLLIRVVAISVLVPAVLATTEDWLSREFRNPFDGVVKITFVSVVILIACVPPIRLWIEDARRARQLQRQNRRRCRKCNYDLRAHQPGDRCPECGTPAPPAGDAR
jgi:uncharacterized paraquat-inducible protein A